MKLKDRAEGGRLLAERLARYSGDPGIIVLGLPRGGLPVASEVARALGAPLDVFVVRKLGVPGHEDLSMGAIATGGVRVLNDEVVRAFGIGRETVDAVTAVEVRELARREAAYRGARPPVDARGRTAILVDDGLATGSTMRAAVRALRRLGPARIVVAVPIAAPGSLATFRPEVDEVACARTPERFYAVSLWYEDFAPTTDAEVRAILDASRAPAALAPPPPDLPAAAA